MLKVSYSCRCASVAMVSNTMDDLPDPETPVKIVILRFGMRREIFFKLFSRAPRISIYSWGMNSPFLSVRNAMGKRKRSAHRFLHKRADLCLFGSGQLLQREGGRPHGAFIEVRRVVEA